MSNLTFIDDAIYGLKIEYGEPVTVGTRSIAQNQRTGLKTVTTTTYSIAMAIPLPSYAREAFLRAIGVKKEGRLKTGEREFLIQKSDIPTGKTIEANNYIDYSGSRYDVISVDEYIFGLIVTAIKIVGSASI